MLTDADLTYIHADLVRRKTDAFGEEIATIDEAQILLAEVGRLRDGIRELHQRHPGSMACDCCQGDTDHCGECSWTWPCPTIRLLDDGGAE